MENLDLGSLELEELSGLAECELEDLDLGLCKDRSPLVLEKDYAGEKYAIKTKMYRCPLCGRKAKGRKGLNIHIRRVHFPNDEKSTGASREKNLSGKKDWSRKRFDRKNEIKIQRTLLGAIYGTGKVNQTIRDYENGKFQMKDLPINIDYYIRLLGVKPKKKPEKDEAPAPKEKSEERPEHVKVQNLKKAVEDSLGKDQDNLDKIVLGLKVSENGFKYISDLIFSESEEVLKIKSTTNKDERINASEVLRYIDGYRSGKMEGRMSWNLVGIGVGDPRGILVRNSNGISYVILDCIGS